MLYEVITISNYDVGDGLQDYEFSELACCKRKNGEFLFGGVRGINAVITSYSIHYTKLYDTRNGVPPTRESAWSRSARPGTAVW